VSKDAQAAASWTVAASLYLNKKPSWWVERPWPAIGGDGHIDALRAGKPLPRIPAEQRLQEYVAETKR